MTSFKLSIDFTERWVVAEDWTYTADLTPFTKNIPHNSSLTTLLVFYGIDTVANIVRVQIILYTIISCSHCTDLGRTPSRLGKQPIQTIHLRRV